MKTLFEFTVNKKVEVEKTVESEVDGKPVKTISIVEENVPIKIAIKKPTRELIDEGKIFNAVESSKAHMRGIICTSLLRKRLAEDGGILTKNEQEQYAKYFEAESERWILDGKPIDELTDAEKERKKQVKNDLIELTQRVMRFEQENQSLFENTVETFARNASLRWWIIFLLYQQSVDEKGKVKEEFVPIFNGKDFDSKLKNYDKLEEEANPFYIEIVKKGANLVMQWFTGQINTPEDFKKASDNYDKELADEVSG